MSNPNSPEARRLAKELSDLRKLQKASHIAPRLPYSSVPEGNLVVTDSEGNVIDVVGSKPKDGQVILPGKAPSKPSTPTVTAQLGTAQVSWDGSYTEEYVAPDLRHLEVHASTDEEFEVTSATVVGTITNVSGGTTTAALEYGTWYFKLVAVTHSEARSVPSETASAEVIPLVEAPDMVEVLDDINNRYDGIITEAGNLGSRLDQATQDLASHETRLGTAEQRVNDAFIEIGQVDQETRTNATAAANAQTKADQAAQDALTATGIANGKGKALIQSTAPAVADRNAVTLWIDTTGGANTPKRWNGTAWVAVTDKAATDAATAAANAQTKAQEALTAAGSAQSTADNALTMAGTKSKVFYSTSAPSGTGTNVNDLWRRIDASKNVIGEWYWTGSAWQSSQITTTAIANLDVGKLTVGTGVISDLVAQHIAGQTAAFQTVDVKNLFATTGTMSEAVINKLWADVVMSKKITAQMLAIGAFDNLIKDQKFEDPTYWSSLQAGPGSGFVDPPTPNSPDTPSKVVLMTSKAQGSNMALYNYALSTSNRIPVVPGDSYSIWSYVIGDLDDQFMTSVSQQVYFYDATGTMLSGSLGNQSAGSITKANWTINQWNKVGNSKIIEVPIGAAFMSPRLTVYKTANTAANGSKYYVAPPHVTRASGGELIVDGAITAGKIAAKAITAEKIAANAVTADAIKAGSIDGMTITGALFQTDKQAGVGIKISNEGIESYDYEGSKTMQITPGSGVDYIGFFGKPMFDDHYTNSDGWMFSSLGAENYVFFTPRRDGDSFRTGSTVRFTFEAQFFVDPDDTTRTSLPVTANVWAYPENTWGSTAGNKRNTSSTFTIDTTARTFDVTVPISQLPSPFMSWVAGLQPADGSAYNGISIQDRVGVRNITAYINGEEIPLNPRQQLAGIDQSGEVSGQELNISGISRLEGPVSMNGDPIDGHGSGEYGPTIMGRDLLGATYTNFFNENHGDGKSAWLTPMPHGLLSNSYHNGWNGTTTNYWTVGGNPGEVQVLTHLRDTVEIKNGRGYLITYTTPAFKVTDGKEGSPGACVLKYAQGRTLGVDSGSAVHGSRYYLSGGPDFDNPGRTVYAVGGQDLPIGDVTIGVEIYVYNDRRIQSTGTADARYWSLNILDVGSAVKGSTGNSQGITKKRPVSAEPAPVDPPPTPKPPVKKTYTKTWNASWWGTWWVGNGNGRNSGLDKDGKVAQGKPPGVGYRQRGAVGFPDMTGTLSGSVISKVEVYVYASHWYSSAGGTLQIGTHDHASKPSVWSRGTTGVKNQKLAKPEGRWITLPTSTHAGVLSGSIKGIQVYTSSTGSSYYGYLTGSKTKIRVTYLK